MKILVVDDERDSLISYAEVLARSRLRVEHVRGSAAAVDRGESEDFDLVLVAARLPDGPGLAVCRRLKARVEHFFPVVLLAPAGDEDGRVAALEQGADEYLTLPIPERELLARIKSLLRIKGLHDRVRALSDVREQVVYTVSHDFRTPLVGIRGAIQNMLAGLVGPFTDQQREYLVLIEEACQRMAHLTEEMTRRARGRRETGQAPREVVDLRSALDTAVAGLRPAIARRGLRLEVRDEAETPPAWGDREALTQVLANLLDNAVKFSPSAGRIRVEIRRDTNRKGGAQVHVLVADEGPGIARSDLERIFFPFEQVGTPADPEGGGAGLGLAMCKEAVEAHGGRIWVESQPGAGARFHVLVPAAVPVGGAA